MSNDPLLPPEASPNDTIAGNRVVAIVLAKEIAKIPNGFRSTPIETQRRLLRRVGEEEEEELKKALLAAIKRGPEIFSDLGKNAPSPEYLSALLERLNAVQESVTATENLFDYLREVEDIALSDAIIVVEKIRRLYQANLIDDPNLKTYYAPVDKVFEARGAAISEGRTRKKNAAPATEKPAKPEE